MLRIDFYTPLTALEIRKPTIGACCEVAAEHDLYVTFHQPQQRALSGHTGQPRSTRQRIGNGKHKDWYVDYQLEEPRVSNPTVIGRLIIKGPYSLKNKQFGGFDYGEYDQPDPTYNHITVYTPSELNHYRPIDLAPDLLALTYEGLKNCFETRFPRLFDVAPFSS